MRPDVAAINWVYLRDQDSFEVGLRTLVKAIDTDLDHVRAHTRACAPKVALDLVERTHVSVVLSTTS